MTKSIRRCPTCAQAMEVESLTDAMAIVLATSLVSPSAEELLRTVATFGPMNLADINAAKWSHVGVRHDKGLQPVNLRQLQAKANKATEEYLDVALLVSQRAEVGGTVDNPVAFLFLVPGSEWRTLSGAEPHVKLSDALVI